MSNVNVRSLSTILRHTAFVVLTCISFLAQDSELRSAAQDQPYIEDQVLHYAKTIDVAKLDPTLPSQPLEEGLLRGPAQIDELNWWVSRDCDLKDAMPDRNGDLPLCVKIPFRRGNVSGIGMLRVGTLKHGIIGKPDFPYLFGAITPFSDRHFGHYDRLSEFPRYLDEIAHTETVAQAAPEKKHDPTLWQSIDQLCGQLELAAPRKKQIIVNGKTETHLYAAYIEGATLTLYPAKPNSQECCDTKPTAITRSRRYGAFEFQDVEPGTYWLRVEQTERVYLIPVRVTDKFHPKLCHATYVGRSVFVDADPPRIQVRIR